MIKFEPKLIVGIRRTDELHSPTGLSKGYIIEFSDNVTACMDEATHYGIQVSQCELWCAIHSDLGQWLTKKLNWLYDELESDASSGEIILTSYND